MNDSRCTLDPYISSDLIRASGCAKNSLPGSTKRAISCLDVVKRDTKLLGSSELSCVDPGFLRLQTWARTLIAHTVWWRQRKPAEAVVSVTLRKSRDSEVLGHRTCWTGRDF